MINLTQPVGKLALQTLAMPADTNANGDIFGGWLVSNMDMAAGIEAKSRVVTVAINNLTFIKPVIVGDIVACFVDLIKVGRTSMAFKIEVWTESGIEQDQYRNKVAEGFFTFVAIDGNGKPQAIDRSCP